MQEKKIQQKMKKKIEREKFFFFFLGMGIICIEWKRVTNL